MAPINTRVAEEQGIAGNILAMMFVPIHSDVDDPLARLRAITEVTTNTKETRNAIAARQMTDLTQHIPSATTALAGRLITGLGLGHRAIRLCNCTITNVPGPQRPLYFNGAKLVKMIGCAPIVDGMGLIITAISYNGEIVFSFSGCREMVPDPEKLSAYSVASFTALQKAAAAEIAKKKTKAKTKAQPKKKAPRRKAS